MPIEKLLAYIEPQQDLHGYDAPWAGGAGKNKLPMTLANMKTINTDGTWNGNAYTLNGVTFTVIVDSDGNVVGVTTSGTASADSDCYIYYGLLLPAERYTLNGCPSGGSATTYRIFATNIGGDTGSGVSATLDGVKITTVRINIKSGTSANNLTFKPMICLESVSDETFAPYSNECPISGWTGLQGYNDPAYGGLILWSEKVKDGNFPDATNWRAYGGTLSTADNVATVTLTGTVANLGTRIDTEPYLQRIAGHKYLSFAEVKVPRTTTGGRFYPVGDKYAQNISVPVNTWTQISALTAETSDNPQAKSQFFLGNSATDGYVTGDSFQIRNVNTFDLTEMFGAGNEPATADAFRALFPHDFYPYNAGEKTTVSSVNGDPYDTFNVSWQSEAGTVYGGTVDVVTGVLTADMGIKTELWKNFTSEATVDTNLIRRQANISSAKGDTENAQKTISNIAPFVRTIADKSVHVSMASSGNYLYAILPTTTDPDLEITFCYPLATPQTYQLTPQQVSTLLGKNTVWVDTGDVSVTYQSTSGSTPVRTSLKSPLKSYSYNALKLFGNTFIEHGKG